MRRRAVVAAGLLGGCRLVDQRTFNPDAGKRPAVAATPPPPAPAPAAPSGPTPLVTIPLEPPTDYDAPLHDAIAAALARNRRSFEVRAMVPGVGTPDAQATATQSASDVAARVARLIGAQGGRTTLSASADPGVTGSAVLVFVR